MSVALLTVAVPTLGSAQQPAPAQNRPATLDLGAIRRDAAKLAEIRSLLADPDPNVRLLAMREIIRSGDPVQRQIAVDAGLTSADVSMVELALRSVMANIQQIVVSLTDMEGKPVTKGSEASSIILTTVAYDLDTGRFSGSNYWSGQLQGSVFSFVLSGGISGKLVWDAETAEFRGVVNLNSGRADWNRKAAWRPR